MHEGSEPRPGPRTIQCGLIVAAVGLLAFWVIWWSDRGLIASRSSHAYYGFEEAFQLADAWLLAALVVAAIQLGRHRPSALLWTIAAGGAGLYLLSMDVYYDVAHGIYASNGGGVIELVIDVLVAGGSAGLLWWTWRYRDVLLTPRLSAPDRAP